MSTSFPTTEELFRAKVNYPITLRNYFVELWVLALKIQPIGFIVLY